MNKQSLEFELKGNISDFTKNMTAAKGDLKKLSEAVKESLGGLPQGKNISSELKAAKKEAEALLKALKAIQDSGKVNLSQATPRQRTAIAGKKGAYESALRDATPSAIASASEKASIALKKEEAAVAKQTAKEVAQAAKEKAAAEKAAAKEAAQAAREKLAAEKAIAKEEKALFDQVQMQQNKQITLRYALYDVSSVANQASAALLNFASASIMAQAAQERAFSNIEKTLGSGMAADEVAKLKSEMIDLGRVIPLSFEDLTQIGMLGSQLGIEADNIASFTDTVAKFTAISGMSAEQAAMGFGKLANLLGISADGYKALAATVSELGNTSAATETQILSTAGQIGAVAKAAGLSASGVIGLSAAMASLRIAPEEARGVLIPTFQEMDRAVRSFNETTGKGSDRLAKFAEISGVSAQDFVKLWSDKAGGGATQVWNKFITGLGDTNIGAALDQIGLAGNRTSKGLTAMATDAVTVLGMMKQAGGSTAGYLDQQFSKISEDLQSSFTILGNSFEALMASFASNPEVLKGLGVIIKGIADVNYAVGKFLSENKMASALMAIAVVSALLLGGLLALAAAAAAGYGGFLALRTAFVSAGQAGVLTNGFIAKLAASMIGMSGSATAAAATTGALAVAETAAGNAAAAAVPKIGLLKLAIRGLLASTGVGVAIALVGMLAEGLMGTQDPLAEAAKGLDEFAGGAKNADGELEPLVDELKRYSDEIFAVRSLTDATQTALYNLGKGFAEGGAGFSSFTAAGRENMANLHGVVQALMDESKGNASALYSNLVNLMQTLKAQGLLSAEAMIYLQNQIAGVATELTTIPKAFFNADFPLKSFFEGMKKGAGKAKTALELLQDAIEKAFKPFKNKLSVEEAFRSLGKSMADSKTDFRVYTETGSANLNNLKDVIDALAVSTNGNKQKMANSLAALKTALVRTGVTGGTAINVLNAALKATGKVGKASATEIAGALRSITTGMSETVEKETKTLSDWVSDLSSVMDDAFELRYGQQSAVDNITEAWYGIKDAADSAKDAVEAAKNEISTLKADKSILEYQLGVAVKYGDTLRATAIRAKLATVSSDLAKQEMNLAQAQDESSMTLVGTSKAAIKNRATIRGLVGDYNSYLVALANSGMSNEQLKIEAGKLADEFMLQGKTLGFAESELKSYIGAFKNDFTNIIDRLPKDITLTVNSDPAFRALSEFIVNFNEELANKIAKEIPITVIVTPVYKPAAPIGSEGSGGGGTGSVGTGGGEVGGGSTVIPDSPTLAAAKTAVADAQAKVDRLKVRITASRVAGTVATTISLSGQLALAETALNAAEIRLGRIISGKPDPNLAVAYAAEGGLIRGPGSATSDSIPARLSNGEYVVKAAAVKYYGTDFMNALNQVQVQRPVNYGSGGSAQGSSSVVYLSPEDRQLLRAAIDRPVNLYTENTRIAASANAGNVVLAQRGSK